MIELTGDAEPHRVVDDDGVGQVSLAAPGVRGRAEPYADADQALAQTAGGALLEHALGNAGLIRSHRTVLLTHTDAASGEVRVSCPPPRAGHSALLLVHDATGAVSFHRPDAQTRAAARTTQAISAPQAMSFAIDQTRFALPPGRPGPLHFAFHKGLSGAKKALSVLEYPVAHLAADGIERWIDTWDRNNHPAVIRWFPPKHGQDLGVPLSPTNWAGLQDGKVLLFVHGIFSTCGGGFAGLGDDEVTWPALEAAYPGRIIGFDHPTASVGVEQNVDQFLAQIPDQIHLDVDVVCHSRGGLVARALAARKSPKVSVSRIVFAGTPNAGSRIVDPTDWSPLVDRLATLMTLPERLLPPPVDAVAAILAGVLELAKSTAIDTELAVPGLEDMAPGSDLLTALAATGTPPTSCAVTAAYTPGSFLHHLFDHRHDEARIVDDRVFHGAANDIAVPTAGIADPGSVIGSEIAGFPITGDALLAIEPGDTYWHCSYFDDPAVRGALVDWLR